MKLALIVLTLAAGADLRAAGSAAPSAGMNSAKAQRWDPAAEFLPHVIEAVPHIIESQDPRTGHFGKGGVWLVTQQNAMLTLAAAWSAKGSGNPYYHSARVLDAIMAGGDALIAEQDSAGRWPFRALDGSSSGQIYMPWTYSRCVRAFAVIQDAMPPERRARWRGALLLGFTGIAAELGGAPVQNIPAHHAMALFAAGTSLGRDDWRRQAAAFLNRVAGAQDPGGFWSEHVGPVVNYNFVYVDALGSYYAMSRDERVRPALERASRFHANFTYPDGSDVETIDERNPYDLNYFKMPNVGFTFSPEGRGFVRQQLRRKMEQKQPVNPDLAASFVLYGEAGDAASPPGERPEARYVLGANQAAIRRDGPWFVCLSAYHCTVVQSRWIQDRQNFLSLFHDRCGLILGGGNTKLQPLWSTFTVGDVSLLSHRPGDTNPNFLPPTGIIHVPSEVNLDPAALSLNLSYGDAHCHVVAVLDRGASEGCDATALTYSVDHVASQPVAAHLPLMPRMGSPWETASGRHGTIGDAPFALAPGEAGDWFAHNGWRISLPRRASIVWPVLPHQPYSRNGAAGAGEGRIVIVLPFDDQNLRYQITVKIPRSG